mmetsp:Transcript_81403/g.264266  ORF Transcript_81403/g.264266 Transcript_81403/m.264266 type:complete len:489 (+) Transcript_81403:167-1633(+)
MSSSWAPLAHTMGLLSGLFSLEDTPATTEPDFREGEPIKCVEELRRIIERAESEGVESEALDDIKSRLEELEQEAQKELTITICHAVSGEAVAVVRARPTDKVVAVLREGVLRETGDALVALRFVVDLQVLNENETFEEVGIKDGDRVLVVRSPLRCLTAAFDGTCRVCSLSDGFSRDEAIVAVESGPVLSASLSPCGGHVLAVCSGGDGCVRDSYTGDLEFHLSGWAASAEWSPDGRRIVGASDTGAARIWCASTGRCLQVLSGHSDDVKSASFSPDGSMIVTASADGTAALWEAESGRLVVRLSGHSDIVRSAAFSPDGAWVLTSSMDATARVWSSSSGVCARVLTGHSKALSGAQFSPDGLRALTASFDGTVRVWDTQKGECLQMLPAENNVVNAASFSPDGSSVLVASASESLRLFCADTGECRFTLSGHEDWVRVAAFSPDGMLVASGSYDGTARIWSALDGQCIQMLEGHEGAVVTAAISAC